MNATRIKKRTSEALQIPLFSGEELSELLKPTPVTENSLITVWFSCGAASAVAAKKTIEKYGNLCQVEVVNNPIKEEHPDNRRFLADVEEWLGQKIEICVNPEYPNCSAEEVWEKRRYMAGIAGAPCTEILKKEARQHWENLNRFKHQGKTYHPVLGFDVNEKKRIRDFRLFERPNLISVLADEGLSKDDCFRILRSEGLKVPVTYYQGLPNGNCLGCVKASSPTYWNFIREHYPDVFEQRSTQSRKLGARLVEYKGSRIYLDELPPDAEGRPLKSMKVECGIYCEEKL